MRQRITILIAVLVFLLLVALMVRDMFRQNSLDSNPYEYSLEPFKEIATNDFCYERTAKITDRFQKLNAICIDQKDQIIVADSSTIYLFGPELDLVRTFNSGNEISSLYADDRGRLYLAMGNQIEVWDEKGKQISSWQAFQDRSILTDITSYEDKICVADAGTKLLLLYDFNGNLIRTMGEKDGKERKYGFMIPSPYLDVDVSRDGHFWVTNPGLHSLEAFDKEGRMISSWSSTSMGLDGFSGCCNPTHFALMSDDSFVTVEKGLVRIKIHEPNGKFRCAVDGPLSFDERESGMDLAVNSKDEIFVVVPSEKSIYQYIKK
jgi:hypothetical protein